MGMYRRLARDKNGELVLTIRISGIHDIYRFAAMMRHGQTDFARAGVRTFRSLREAMGRTRYKGLDDFFHGRRPTVPDDTSPPEGTP